MIPSSKAFDFIITGFGCAGMSLIYYLLHSKLKNKSVLIIESENKDRNDRTWCYWAESPLDIHPKNSPLISWNQIGLTVGTDVLKTPLGKTKYYHITSSDFYSNIIALIQEFPNVILLQDKVISISDKENTGVEVVTANTGSYFGTKVFNSIIFDHSNGNKKNFLKQVFLGWRVKSDVNCFDSKTATFMDFFKPDSCQPEFFYLLPFNEKEALLEYTVFTKGNMSKKEMESALLRFITVNLKLEKFEVIFREEGQIPMTTSTWVSKQSKNIIPLGIAAGCSKPSTGFTFHAIQKHCSEIVEKLETNPKQTSLFWKRKARFNFYDNILLNIAVKWPKQLPSLFLNLFESNSASKILSFLNEETSFREEIQLLLKLKFPVFIKSLIHYEKH